MFDRLRQQLKELEYPTNHHYDPEFLEPLGDLKTRVALLYKNAPQMMEGGESLLDVGFNKGFISFHLSKVFKRIVGYEPGKEFVDIARKIKDLHGFDNIEFLEGDFHSMPSNVPYDVVYVGNCLHYIFREDIRKGLFPYSFIDKMKSVCSRILVIDGPQNYWEFAMVGMAKDEGWPVRVYQWFTQGNLISKIGWRVLNIAYNGIGDKHGNSRRTTIVFEKI
jgi:ubiquinone/menaquinone biosynthesis C-methylase UbiE